MTARFLTVVCATAAMLAISSPSSADDLSTAIVDPAVAIQTALVKDSLAGVQGNAQTIEERATALGASGAKIAAAAKELKGTTKLTDARTAFGRLSEAIVAYMEQNKLTPGKGTRIAICPMVNKPWLQRDGPIQNPYFGQQMPTCGNFKP